MECRIEEERSMKNSKSVVTNYIYNVMYNILVIVLPLFTTPYVSRVLGAEKLGQYGYTQSVVYFFVLFGTLGTQIFAQREIAYHQENKQERSRVFWEMLILRMTVIGIVSVVYGIKIVVSEQYRLLYIIQIIDLLAAFFDVTWFFQGIEEFKKTVLRNIIVKTTIVGLIFILVKEQSDLPIYVCLHSVSLLLGNLSLYFYLPTYINKVSVKLLHPFLYLHRVIALFIPQIAVQIYATLDKAMLGYIGGEQNVQQVGYYEQAQKIVRLLLAIITALGTVMLPRMANAYSKNEHGVIKKSLNTSFQFIFFLGCPLMVGISTIAGKLVPWFYGSGYEPVAGIIIATSPIIIITGLNNLMGMQFLVPTQRQKQYTIAVSIASVTNVILNIILIPHYDAFGAVAASVLAETAAIIIEMLYIREYIEGREILVAGIKYICMSAVMGVGVWLVGKNRADTISTTIIQILSGGTIYLLLLVALKDKFFKILLDKFHIKAKFLERE